MPSTRAARVAPWLLEFNAAPGAFRADRRVTPISFLAGPAELTSYHWTLDEKGMSSSEECQAHVLTAWCRGLAQVLEQGHAQTRARSRMLESSTSGCARRA